MRRPSSPMHCFSMTIEYSFDFVSSSARIENNLKCLFHLDQLSTDLPESPSFRRAMFIHDFSGTTMFKKEDGIRLAIRQFKSTNYASFEQSIKLLSSSSAHPLGSGLQKFEINLYNYHSRGHDNWQSVTKWAARPISGQPTFVQFDLRKSDSFRSGETLRSMLFSSI